MVGRWWLAALSAVTFLALAVVSGCMRGGFSALFAWPFVLSALATASLYLLAHVMRAVRLAVIAMPLLGLSFRTSFYLHFFVAPWSLVMPWKLDEFIRLYEIHRAGKSWSRGVVALVIDRSMDGIVLVALALLLFFAGRAELATFMAIVGVGLIVVIATLFTLPVLLEAAQRYIFANHGRDIAIWLLRVVNYLRLMLLSGRDTIGATWPFLMIMTVGIWTVEWAAVCALFPDLLLASHSPIGTLELMLSRTDQSWRMLLSTAPTTTPVALLTFCFFGVLLLVWGPATMLYMRRRWFEPSRTRQLNARFARLREGR